ncbi:hypothetical protein TrLO_g12664 [Triparma laevis f. longispina]|uniref:RWD domain-containing protein n=2 Tax=Triparma laevis TaxID=1534972 RepID=A0A9W7CEW9_9STRA|nr:hypothetical protein TrLO_g12664 [Triparma laevis f. longispina]
MASLIAASSFAARERDALTKSIFISEVEASTLTFIRVKIFHSRYRKIRSNLTFPEDYPKEQLVVEITSQGDKGRLGIPVGLKKKLEVEAMEACKKVLEGGRKEVKPDDELTPENSQVLAACFYLKSFLDSNRFVSCWKELKQTASLVTAGRNTIRMSDSTGIILVNFISLPYTYSAQLSIDEGYPSTLLNEVDPLPIKIKVKSTNFPHVIETMITKQAIELVRRCCQGRDPVQALQMSNPIRAPRGFVMPAGEDRSARITRDTIKDLERDRETLLKMKKLKDVDQAKQAHNHKAALNSTKERKDARRELNKLAHKEIERDDELEKKMSQAEIDRAKLETGWQDDGDPVPSLLPTVNFLIDSIVKFQQGTCPVCNEMVLPKNPEDLKRLFEKSPEGAKKTAEEKKARKEMKKKRPVRCYCNCWYHAGCLEAYMTEPPFGGTCQGTCSGGPVHHPDYPEDKRILERTWNSKQARLREMEDAMLFL